MFRRKNSATEKLAVLTSRFSTLAPETAVSISTLGIDGTISDASVDFVFLLLEHESPEQFRILASKAIEMATEHNAILVANAGGLMQFAVDLHEGNTCDAAPGISLALALAHLLGTSAKVAYGRTVAHVGIVGTELRRNWGFFPVRIGQILRALLDATPGVALYLESNKER